jgi:hypothetical protein
MAGGETRIGQAIHKIFPYTLDFALLRARRPLGGRSEKPAIYAVFSRFLAFGGRKKWQSETLENFSTICLQWL